MSFGSVAGMENVAYAKCINLAVGASARPVVSGVERDARPSPAGEEINSTSALHAYGKSIVLTRAWLCSTSCIYWDSMIALQTTSTTISVELHDIGRAFLLWDALSLFALRCLQDRAHALRVVRHFVPPGVLGDCVAAYIFDFRTLVEHAWTRSESIAMTFLKNMPSWSDLVKEQESDMLSMLLASTEQLRRMHRSTVARHSAMKNCRAGGHRARDEGRAAGRTGQAEEGRAASPVLPCMRGLDAR